MMNRTVAEAVPAARQRDQQGDRPVHVLPTHSTLTSCGGKASGEGLAGKQVNPVARARSLICSLLFHYTLMTETLCKGTLDRHICSCQAHLLPNLTNFSQSARLRASLCDAYDACLWAHARAH